MKYPNAPITPLQQTGITLVELVISLVIISIALTGIFSVINLTVSHSSDPVVDYQAIAIAESYLEEILLHAYSDPNNTGAVKTRDLYDNVGDYNGLNDTGVHDQLSNQVTTLSTYNVSVSVAAPVDVSGVSAKVITVTVTEPRLPAPLILIGYKFDY
jgi:MSHA pilin protein MshD